MLISLARRRKHKSKKVKSPESQNRSTFLKMLFGIISGDSGNSIMAQYSSGNHQKFAESWKKVSEKVLERSIERAKGLGKYEQQKSTKEATNENQG